MIRTGALVLTAVSVAVTGCDGLLNLRYFDHVDDAMPDVAIDVQPPEQCAYASAPVMLTFPSDVDPHHDLSVAGGQGFVHGWVTFLNSTVPRFAALTTTDGITFDHDLGARDTAVTNLGVLKIVPGLIDTVDAVEAVGGGQEGISRYHLESAVWVQDQPPPSALQVDVSERIGNARELAGIRYYATIHLKVAGGNARVVELKSFDLAAGTPALNTDAKMAAINTASNPDMGVLTRDGLTLIYSAQLVGDNQYDLFVSHRASTSASFGVGTPIDALNTAADEREPWIGDTCDRLYFRRGTDILANGGVGSTFWVAAKTP